MITRWPGGKYAESDRGKFEVWLLRQCKNEAVAYTDGSVVRITSDYKDSDKDAVKEFAEQYGLEVVW